MKDQEAASGEEPLQSLDAITEQPDSVSTPSAPERLGTVEKCPICGSRVDVDAYHCPTCRNTFCFHCRARVSPSDYQYQCVNQRCNYYGKLLCDVCEEEVEQEHPPAVYMEPEEGFWPVLLIVMLVASGFVWSWSSIGWATLSVFIGFPMIGLLLQTAGLNIFGRFRRVEHRRKSLIHQCLYCHHPVKELTRQATGLGHWPGAETACKHTANAIEVGFPGDDQ